MGFETNFGQGGDASRDELLSGGKISHEDAMTAHERAIKEADKAIEERENAIATYNEGLESARLDFNEKVLQIKALADKLSVAPREQYAELNQAIQTLERKKDNTKEQITAYEKNITDAKSELEMAKERKANLG